MVKSSKEQELFEIDFFFTSSKCLNRNVYINICYKSHQMKICHYSWLILYFNIIEFLINHEINMLNSSGSDLFGSLWKTPGPSKRHFLLNCKIHLLYDVRNMCSTISPHWDIKRCKLYMFDTKVKHFNEVKIFRI